MSDHYTKAVLTAIALTLVALVGQNAVGSAHAAGAITKVAICDAQNDNCANVGNDSPVVWPSTSAQ